MLEKPLDQHVNGEKPPDEQADGVVRPRTGIFGYYLYALFLLLCLVVLVIAAISSFIPARTGVPVLDLIKSIGDHLERGGRIAPPVR